MLISWPMSGIKLVGATYFVKRRDVFNFIVDLILCCVGAV